MFFNKEKNNSNRLHRKIKMEQNIINLVKKSLHISVPIAVLFSVLSCFAIAPVIRYTIERWKDIKKPSTEEFKGTKIRVGIFFLLIFLGFVSILIVPTQAVILVISLVKEEGFNSIIPFFRQAPNSVALGSLSLIAILLPFLKRLSLFALSGGRDDGVFRPRPTQEVKCLPTKKQSKSLKIYQIQISTENFPDLGIGCFTIAIVAQWMLFFADSDLGLSASNFLGFVTFWLIDDYLLFRQIKFHNCNMMPFAPMQKRLIITMLLPLVSAISCLLFINFVSFVIILLAALPGIIWVSVHYDEMRRLRGKYKIMIDEEVESGSSSNSQ